MKRLFWWIFAMIVAVTIFCVTIIVIPIQTKNIETSELTYIFIDDTGWERDIFNNETHGAADDWAFLFEEENSEKTGEYLPNKDYVWAGGKEINLELDDEILEEILEKEIVDESVEGVEGKNIETIKYNDCITPWGNKIKNGESILAYQQRSDVPSVCNVQRRVCEDGDLKWYYQQSSCIEDIKYEYTRVKMISFNNKEHGDLIQNPEYAKNDSAEFDTDGKINQPNKAADTSWNNNYDNSISNDSSTDLTHKNYQNCVNPWGDIVSHGQFIRAYESSVWFVDDKCKVELRLCLDGNLKWNYSYKNCEHMDITSQDYKAGNNDITKPTPDLLIETLTDMDEEKNKWWWLFNWIWNLFN